MNASLISIVIPCHNAAPWLRETLVSAFAQTWTSIEIIVVDDGSTDSSSLIAREFVAQGLRLVLQSNAGAASARNHGLRLARGEYIQFLDADDLISPRKIELQLARLAAARAGSVATCRWGRFEDDPTEACFVDNDVFRDFRPMDWLILHASHARMMHPAAWLVPRAVADRAGPWDETLSLNDDGEYFARVVLASSDIAFTPSTAASSYYRSGLTGSLSRRRSPNACASLYRTGVLLQQHLLADEDSARVRAALADHWRHLAYELYPDAPTLSRDAEARSKALGGSAVPPPLGARARMLSRLVGWRLARRLALRR